MVVCRLVRANPALALWNFATLLAAVGQETRKYGFLQSLGTPRFYDFPDIDNVADASHHVMVFTNGEASYYESVRSAFRDTATKMIGEDLVFIEVKNEYPDTFKFFNFHVEENLPLVVIVNWTNGMGNKPFKQYLLPTDDGAAIPQDSLETFARRFLLRQLEPWVRSEPVIEEVESHRPQDGAMVIVGTQFPSLVLDKAYDVVVMFFAPWCGFSKKMQPRLDDLAHHVQHVPTMRVFKIDATKNDISHSVMTQLTGYPFLALFPAADKENGIALNVQGEFLDDGPAWVSEAIVLLRQDATHPISDPPNATVEELPSDSGLLDSADELQEF